MNTRLWIESRSRSTRGQRSWRKPSDRPWRKVSGQTLPKNIFTFQSKLKTYQMILIYHVAQWLHTRGIAAKSFNVQLMGSKCDRMPYFSILGTNDGKLANSLLCGPDNDCFYNDSSKTKVVVTVHSLWSRRIPSI